MTSRSEELELEMDDRLDMLCKTPSGRIKGGMGGGRGERGAEDISERPD